MNRIIGDRKEKSTLDEMEEVARERNAEVAEEERIEKLEAARRAKEEAEKAKAPSEAGSLAFESYMGVEWDLHVPRGGDKSIFTYDESLERLKKEGKRHPTPAEVFTLLAAEIEGKLQGDLSSVAKDILSGKGEWLSMAAERKGNKLVCYLHPEGLVWNNIEEKYEKSSLVHSGEYTFDIKGKKSGEWDELSAFSDDFVEFMYGRKLNDLPQAMKQGDVRAQVFVPAEGKIWHAGIEGFHYGLILRDTFNLTGASRGVKEKEAGSGRIGLPDLNNYIDLEELIKKSTYNESKMKKADIGKMKYEGNATMLEEYLKEHREK